MTIVQGDPSPAEISSHHIPNRRLEALPFLGNRDAAQSHRRDRFELGAREMLLAIPLRGVRRKALAGELAHGLAQKLVRFAERHAQSGLT